MNTVMAAMWCAANVKFFWQTQAMSCSRLAARAGTIAPCSKDPVTLLSCTVNADGHGTATLMALQVAGGVVHALDRDGKNRTIQVDVSEYMFKLALLERKYEQVSI